MDGKVPTPLGFGALTSTSGDEHVQSLPTVNDGGICSRCEELLTDDQVSARRSSGDFKTECYFTSFGSGLRATDSFDIDTSAILSAQETR